MTQYACSSVVRGRGAIEMIEKLVFELKKKTPENRFVRNKKFFIFPSIDASSLRLAWGRFKNFTKKLSIKILE